MSVEWWTEIAKQVPSLAVLAVVVKVFVDFLRTEGDRASSSAAGVRVALWHLSAAIHSMQGDRRAEELALAEAKRAEAEESGSRPHA